jgi:hypothetical protein
MIKLNETYFIDNEESTIVFSEGNKGTVNGNYEIRGKKDTGTINGTLDGNVLKGTFHNKIGNSTGFIEFAFTENGFDAKWKSGLEPGPMRGKWNGKLSDSGNNTKKDDSSSLSAEQLKWIEKKDAWDYEEAPKEWLHSKEFILNSVKKDENTLEFASDELKNDKEIVKTAVLKNGWALQYASDSCKDDKEVVLAALSTDGTALEYASESLKKDREVVLAAVSNYGGAIEHATETLKADKEIVLAAVSNEGCSLEYVAEEFKSHKEIVLKAVLNNGYALEYASENLRDDKEVVLAAISKDGGPFEYASENLLNNKELLILAVSKDSSILKLANEELKKDKEVLAAAVSSDSSLSYSLNEHLSEEQKQYLEEGITLEDFDAEYQGGNDGKVAWMKEKHFLLEAIKQDVRILKHASDELKADRELISEAIKNDISAIDYADEKLQSDPELLIARIILHFKGDENISINDEDINIFVEGGEFYDPLEPIEKLLFKVEFIVLKNRKEEFHSFYKKIIDFVNKNHECFWILQAVSARLETIESNASWYEENPDHYTNVCELTQSFDIVLEFEPSIEFETYYNDSEISTLYDGMWTSNKDEEGLHFTEFIMDKTSMEWDTESWDDAKFYNHAISRIWVGLINYSLRYLHEGFDEENGAICLHSVVQEYYEPIQDSGCADYGINTFRVISEYLLEIPKNDYDLNETDRDDLEEFNGWQFDLQKVAQNFLNRDLFDCEYPEPTEQAKEKL